MSKPFIAQKSESGLFGWFLYEALTFLKYIVATRLYSGFISGEFSIRSLAIFTVFFFLLACWTYGSSVPSGLFVPCLLCGAAYGRLVATVLVKYV